jgi:site-specific DNA recombinase
LLTAMDNPWTAVAVRDVLTRPMNAGLVEYEGAPVGRMPGEPILEMSTFERLRALRASRRRGRVPSESYVATGILRCGRCDHVLAGRKLARKDSYADGTRQRRYYCPKQRGGCGKTSVVMSGADREIELLVVERLSDPEHAAQVTAYTTKRAERLAQVREDIADVEELAEALSDRLGRMEMTLSAFDRANKPLAARLAALVAERTSLESGELGPVNVATREEIQAQWDAADPAGRRTMLTRALGRWHLVVDPPRQPGRGFDRERLRLVPPDSDQPGK